MDRHQLAFLVVLLLAAIGSAQTFGGSAGSIGPATFPNGYKYRHVITVNASVVPSTQSNFPMLIYGTYSDLATVANGGKVQNTVALNSQTVPADLIFTSDLTGATLLKWEVASYTAASGLIEAWVKLPTLSNGTVIYAFYGKAAVTTYQGGATSAWDASYKGVWHLQDVGTPVDSTINANTLTNNAATNGAGQIGGGAVLSVSQTLSIASFASPANITVSAWVNSTNLSGGSGAGQQVAGMQPDDGSFSSDNWQLALNPSVGSNARFLIFSGGGVAAISAGTLATANTWHYLVGTYDGTNLNVYFNGAATTTAPAVALNTNTTTMILGNIADGGYGLIGTLDEFRVSSIARSADWITAEYNNQSNPAAFYVW